MNIGFTYSRPQSGAGENEVFGLDVAITNLLSAWLRHGRQDKFICRPTDMPSYEHFQTLAQQAGHDPAQKCLGLDPRYPRETLGGISCLFQPDPNIADIAWQRLQVTGPAPALCGLVHTMSGERIARAVGDLCLAPTTDRDALICPSRAIRDAVRALWDIQADYLNHRFGSTFSCPMQLPVIPLGIDTEKFTRLGGPELRQRQRQALNAQEDEIVILFHGRLSFATKAHPVSLFLAAEQAAKATRKKLRLVLFGYFKPPGMEPFFRLLGQDICKTVQLEFIANTDTRFPEGVWAGADIFVSLSDNIQESFGLAPIEAMAAGLPVIVSDWDGYRDAVRHGEDGFAVPTLTPPPSAGMDMALRYGNRLDNYGEYLGGVAQSTALDVPHAAQAMVTLAENAELRKNCARNAQTRAQQTYDWRVIIRAYEDLWRDLGRKRPDMAASPLAPASWQAAAPAFPNPLRMFSAFPSATLDDADRLKLTGDSRHFTTLLNHEMNYFVPGLLLAKDDLVRLADKFSGQGARLDEVLALYPPADHSRVRRSCAWMVKMALCQRIVA